jgi:hypothetical protein
MYRHNKPDAASIRASAGVTGFANLVKIRRLCWRYGLCKLSKNSSRLVLSPPRPKHKKKTLYQFFPVFG